MQHPSHLLREISIFLQHQITVIVFLVIQRTDQFHKLQVPVLRLLHLGDDALAPLGCEDHEYQDRDES